LVERRVRVPWWLWLIAALVLTALIAALVTWWQPLKELLPVQEQIRAWVESLGAWGPVVILLLEMIQTLLAPIPGQAIEAASGYLYGPFWGTVYPMIGMAIGSLTTFLLARRFGRPLVIRLIGKQSMARLDDLVRRGGAPFFFLIWLLPGAPDDLACVAAGLTPMPPHQFMILMLVGRLPGVFGSVLLGATATRISPTQWAVLIAVFALVVLAIWRWGDRGQEFVLQLVERLSNRLQR
jgi:uncharacterized membrane protein YdjX (TVP38/TMEM64 family)